MKPTLHFILIQVIFFCSCNSPPMTHNTASQRAPQRFRTGADSFRYLILLLFTQYKIQTNTYIKYQSPDLSANHTLTLRHHSQTQKIHCFLQKPFDNTINGKGKNVPVPKYRFMEAHG